MENRNYGSDNRISFDKKRILITGANSYIGESFKAYAESMYGDNFVIDTVDMVDGSWRKTDFSTYDSVFHVAGLAHADVSKVSEETKKKYYEVNTDLAVETAQKSKAEGVKQFIFMSSIIIYGESSKYGRKKVITKYTKPSPANFYGDSKWQADKGVRKLADEKFNVLVIRPPMIYGNGSKGNYPILSKMAKTLPVFPNVDNERSMLYIDNLCEFLCQVILIGNGGIFFPQNEIYTRTSDMVSEIARVTNHHIFKLNILNLAVLIGSKIPGAVGNLINKAFGNMVYAQELSTYPGINYRVVSFKDSIKRTEERKIIDSKNKKKSKDVKKHILVVSQYFHPESFRINDICQEWVKQGYKVTVITGIPNYPQGKFYRGYGYTKKRKETWKGIDIVRIPLIARGNTFIGLLANYVSFVIAGFLKKMTLDIKADYVFTFEVSPMTQALVGVWFAKKMKIPHYLYVQDLWPENVETITGIHNPVVIRPIDKMVDYIYKNTDEIFVTSQSFVEAICNRKVKVNRKKVHYWPQYAEDFYRPMEKIRTYDTLLDDSFKIAFTGNIGYSQGLQILPKTAELLKDNNFKFVIVGNGRYMNEFKEEIHQRGVIDKFVMIPQQPPERIPEILSSCDAAFISFMDTKLFEMTIPAKLQSYMACGMPIVASASGETKRIIEEAHCGICSQIGDCIELVKAIEKLLTLNLEEMGQNARNYYDKNFDKKRLMSYFKEHFL